MHSHVQQTACDASRELLERAESLRVEATQRLDPNRRSVLGQFLTPVAIARFMASLFKARFDDIGLLDAGAGVGSLFAAFVGEMCSRLHRPKTLSVIAYEIDPLFTDSLKSTLKECRRVCRESGIDFSGEAVQEDFIRAGVEMLGSRLFVSHLRRFNCAILNPPYHKINSDSPTRRLLSSIGIETSNLYTAFLAIVVKLLEPGGELVAITPRSFCNGPYFKPFRKGFLADMSIKRIHVFASRERAFQDDEVLQENVILHAVKEQKRTSVLISSSVGPDDPEMVVQKVDYLQVVKPADAESFIHIVTNDYGAEVARKMNAFSATLEDLGLCVSTGRVVDFRARDYLRPMPDGRSVPLIYACHFEGGFVSWPKPQGRKPNAIVRAPETEFLLIPSEIHVLVKRFSAKEERRRIVAAVYDPSRLSTDVVGFENHLNYFHRNGKGLPKDLATGLAVYLNSALVDAYFRQFNGHTQVNATDLRSLKYPSLPQLEAMGSKVGDTFPGQEEIDAIFERETRAAEPNPSQSKVVKGKEAN